MTKLTHMQVVLLSAAAARADSSLLPPAESLGDLNAGVRRSILSLMRKGLAEEVSVADQARAWREEDGALVGIIVTAAGRVAVGAEPVEQKPISQPEETPGRAAPVRKIGSVLEMLQREEGATIEEMMAATGWLSHSTRAVLTGLRKKGHVIDKAKRGTVTCYKVEQAA